MSIAGHGNEAAAHLVLVLIVIVKHLRGQVHSPKYCHATNVGKLGALAIEGFRMLVACVGLLSAVIAHVHMIYAAETWTDVMVGIGATPRDVVRGA